MKKTGWQHGIIKESLTFVDIMEEKLIEFIRQNEILYDKTHAGYKNIIKKDKKWEEIAVQTNQSVEMAKKRWKTIRDRYYRILKEEKGACTSGSGQYCSSAQKYKYFDQLSFLKECKTSNMSPTGNYANEKVIELVADKIEEKLIEFIRQNKILYDKTHVGYKNIIQKDKIWEEIAVQTNQSVEMAKKRWKTIRDRYYRILKEEKGACTSGSGQYSSSAQKYKYFDQLSFLKECKTSNMSTIGNHANEKVIKLDNYGIEESAEIEEIEEIGNGQNIGSLSWDSSRSSTPKALKSYKKQAELAVHAEMLDAIKSFRKREDKPTPITLFMQSVALQIDKANLSSERLLDLQSNILMLVRNAVSENIDFGSF